jgi:hypothetical protein
LNQIQVLEGHEAQAAIDRLLTVVTLLPNPSGSKEEGAPQVALLKQAQFVAAPVMHTGTLTSEVLKKLFDAAQATGQSEMTAIGLYSAEEQHCYQIPMNFESLDDLRGTSCGVINFVLYGGQPDWLVLFHDQLYIAYGSEAFVTSLTGDISSAFQAIESRLDEMYAEYQQGDIPGYVAAEINRMGQYLESVLMALSSDYVKAAVGDRVKII